MSVFSGITKAKATNNFAYFEPDHDWVVLVTGCKQDVKRDRKTEFSAVNCRVIESTCDRARPGAERSWWNNLMVDAGKNNWKNFMLAGSDMSEEEFNQMSDDDAIEACDRVMGEDQPFANMIVGLKTVGTKTREGNDFTKHMWSTLPADKVKAMATKARELGILVGPLCDLQADIEKKAAKK